MATYDRKNYIVAICALLVSVGSVLLAYFAINASWKIAELSGSLDKSEIVVGLQMNSLPLNGITQIVVGAAELSEKTVPVIGAIPFSVVSNGKKTVDGLTLTFQYHKMFKRSALENLKPHPSGEYGATELKRSFTETDDISFVSYKFTSLNPGVSALIAEPIYLVDTKMHVDVPVTFKDGVKATVPIDATYSVQFALSVSAHDVPMRVYPVSVSIERAASLEDMLKGRVREVALSEQKRIRKEIGFLRYLSSLISSAPTGSMFLVYVPLEEVKNGNLRVFGPKDGQRVAVANFDLLAWNLLFED